ncbi:sortase B [Kineothrix alysoides]|uniref:Sortase B n=2 Tax=Kineothrix alysoides TaxID=1469948 RepID=A0A4R1QTR0_9FIRM|nr:sortase B [Kineothrix alysoides]
MIHKYKRCKKSTKEKAIDLCIGILCTIVVAGCLSVGIYFYSLSYDAGEFHRLIETAEDRNTAFADLSGDMPPAAAESERFIDLTALQQENSDIVGWITIQDTMIDYPVMYTPKDGEYYLHRNFMQKYSLSGVPFIDAACSVTPRSDNVIVYGHNMKNGSMFSGLLSYQDETYWRAHKKILFYTSEEVQEYEILAAFLIDAADASQVEKYFSVNFSGEKEFDSYIEAVKKKSFYRTEVDVQYGDGLLTLSTCSYQITDGRFLVIAKQN